MQKIKRTPFLIPSIIFFFFFLILGVASSVKIFAQDYSSTTLPPCVYNCVKWGECQVGNIRYCQEYEKSPSKCREASAPPLLTQGCNFNYPTCIHSCLEWGPCQPNGKMICVNTRVEPENCAGGIPPSPRDCAYSPPSCVYSYSEWSACTASGYQYRKVIEASPSGCTGNPELKRQCVYKGDTSSNTSSGNLTPDKSSSPTCSYTCSAWSDCRPEGYKTRKCSLPSGNDCVQKEEKASCAPSSETSKEDEKTTGQCTITCSNWSICNLEGLQFRNCWPTPNNCPGETFQNQQKCKPSVCVYEYTPWSQCLDGWQYRSIVSAKPESCVDKEQKLKQSCKEVSVSGENLIENEISQPVLPIDPEFSVNSEWKEEKFGTSRCPENICGEFADPDQDGLSNNDELRYGSDPLNRDVDQDGKKDGEEIASGTNPLVSSAKGEKDKIEFEDVRKSGKVVESIYQVNEPALVSLGDGRQGLSLSGKGPALSYLNVFLYSETPLILTVKTDEEGNWFYVLEDEIEDGEHEIYVATTDSTGRVKNKSNPWAFIKTAQAITQASAAQNEELKQPLQPKEVGLSFKIVILIIFLSFLSIIAGFVLIGFILKKMADKIKIS